jgi:uncharacterized protein (TIGR02611 family)
MADEPPPSSEAQRPTSPIVERLEERRERHLQRSRAYRAAVVVAGFMIILAGVVLSGPGVPGPGFLVILIGLGLLALEFTWAANLLERAVEYGERAKERAERTSTWQRVLGGVLTALAVAAFIVVAILYDIPLLPV